MYVCAGVSVCLSVNTTFRLSGPKDTGRMQGDMKREHA